jgi:cytochrome P450
MEDRAHTPPGLPVVGDAPRFARDPLRYLVGVQEAYGGQYSLVRLEPPAGDDVVIVLDPELAHDVLGDRERFRRPNAAPTERRRNGLIASDGALWERQRSVLEPEFVGTRLASYAEITGDTLEDTLAAWPDRGEIDLLEEMSILTMRVITQSLFSRDTTRERGRTVHDAMAAVNAEFEADPLDAVLPESLQSGPSEAFEEADDVLEDVATEFVDWHLAQDDPPEDVLTALIEAKRDPDIELSENELVDQTILFMTGGQETTALTLVYAFYWLSQHPDLREAVREEATEALGGDAPGWADLSELTLTERVVRETLRLTPAAWSVSREPRHPVDLAGTRLDAGTVVLMPIYAHQRDSCRWADATSFRPDRWIDEASRGDAAYYPFGSGPRVCIGRQVALTEAQFTLAHVLQHYDVEVLADDLALHPAVTLRPGREIRAELTALA